MKKLVILIIIIFISCEDDPLKNEPLVNYFPLQVGNEWSFTYPSKTNTSQDTIKSVEYKINATKIVNGKTYYSFEKRMPFFPFNSVIKGVEPIFIRQNNKGDIMILVDNSEYLYFTFDETLLDTYVNTKIKDVDYSYKIESINDTVITTVGSFTGCYRIFNGFPQIQDIDHYTWFAPDYGPVKIHTPATGLTSTLDWINISN